MEKHSNQKTKDKMAIGDDSVSLIILNVSGLNSPIKRRRWIKKLRPNYMVPLGNPSQLRQTQTQSEEVEDNIQSKWHPEKSGYSHIYMRQKRFQD